MHDTFEILLTVETITSASVTAIERYITTQSAHNRIIRLEA